MTDAQVEFQLLEFEHVEAAPDTALLRVSGRGPADMASGPLALVITVDGEARRHEQLPALPGPPDIIRAAFSAPATDVAEGSSFGLELADGQVVSLPAPVRRRAPAGTSTGHHGTAVGGGSGGGAAEGEAGAAAEAERQAESQRIAIADLERRLQSERERRAAVESDLAHLRSERDGARAERDAAVAERDEAVADRDEAEARARTAAANAGALEAQIRAAGDTAARTQTALEAQLADRTAELERVRAAAEMAQARAHATRREVTTLDEQLAHAQAQVMVLERALEEREATHAAAIDAQARIDAGHAEIERIHAEIETLRHRNGELEATLAELDAALATRAAEIDLLREQIRSDREQSEHWLATLRAETDRRAQAEEALLEAEAQLRLRS